MADREGVCHGQGSQMTDREKVSKHLKGYKVHHQMTNREGVCHGQGRQMTDREEVCENPDGLQGTPPNGQQRRCLPWSR